MENKKRQGMKKKRNFKCRGEVRPGTRKKLMKSRSQIKQLCCFHKINQIWTKKMKWLHRVRPMPCMFKQPQLYLWDKSEKQAAHISEIVFIATILIDLNASLNNENRFITVLGFFKYLLYAKKCSVTFKHNNYLKIHTPMN